MQQDQNQNFKPILVRQQNGSSYGNVWIETLDNTDARHVTINESLRSKIGEIKRDCDSMNVPEEFVKFKDVRWANFAACEPVIRIFRITNTE